MPFKPPTKLSLPSFTHHARALHALHRPILTAPKPTPFVPDAPTFLTLIGRNMSAHASKIPSWEALFSLTSAQLKEAGVEPARARKYLLWWRERFRQGTIGIGGDCAHVKDGVAELRITEVDSGRPADAKATLTKGAGRRRVVVNTRSKEDGGDETQMGTVIGQVRIAQGFAIAGRGIQALQGEVGAARLQVQEGLWEQKQGHKVDGGERRRAEVRYKRKVAEKRAR
nr:protein fyv4, mitochondrial [Quercus suber]